MNKPCSVRYTEAYVIDEYLKQSRIREKRCAKTLKGEALLVIDHILTNIESEDKLLSTLYRIAHCSTGVCENPHEDWQEEVHKLYKEVSNV